MLQVVAKEYNFSLQNTTLSACPLVFNNNFDWIKSIYKIGCSVYTHSVFEEAKKYDTVIVGGIWSEYYEEEGFQEGFEETMKQLSINVKHIILLAQTPIFLNYNHKCEERKIRIKELDCRTHFNHKLEEGLANIWMYKIAGKYDNVEYFSIRNQLCTDDGCSPYIDHIPVYYNAHHLSLRGSGVIGHKMLESNDSMLKAFNHLKRVK